MRDFLTATKANSAATKKPLAKTRTITRRMFRKMETREMLSAAGAVSANKSKNKLAGSPILKFNCLPLPMQLKFGFYIS
jgi:hypothetical protein